MPREVGSQRLGGGQAMGVMRAVASERAPREFPHLAVSWDKHCPPKTRPPSRPRYLQAGPHLEEASLQME